MQSAEARVREETQHTVYANQSWLRAGYFGEMWNYRELLIFLTWRDIKVRYKQAVLGISWAIIQPLATIVIFSLFFGRFAKMPSDGLPYPLFSFSAMIPWTFFTVALGRGINSVVANSNMISKVYFPRAIVPIAAVGAGLVDYAIGSILLLGCLFYYDYYPSLMWVVAWPFLTMLIFLMALGVSFWLSALNVRYRDVHHITPFLIQLWMFASPIVYPIGMIPERFRWLVDVNPMAGIIDGYRTLLLGRPIDTQLLMSSSVIILLNLVSGFIFYAKTERKFADVI